MCSGTLGGQIPSDSLVPSSPHHFPSDALLVFALGQSKPLHIALNGLFTHSCLDGPSLHLFPSVRQSPPTSEALDPRRAGEQARPRLQSILNVCLFGVKSYCQTIT